MLKGTQRTERICLSAGRGLRRSGLLDVAMGMMMGMMMAMERLYQEGSW